MFRILSRRFAFALTGLVIILSTASCSWVSGWFEDDDPAKPVGIAVFDARIGDCFLAPEEVKAELTRLEQVPCDVEHQQELFAWVTYGEMRSQVVYPGDAVLDTYANGACAEEFSSYVGIDYPDSGLWITYLLPSARSWQQGLDRSIMCFVTTTGEPLTQSVKGSKL